MVVVQHPNLSNPNPKEKDAKLCFVVHHYAGKVSYNVSNFLEKNKDALHEDIRAVLCASGCSLFASLLPEPESAAKAASRFVHAFVFAMRSGGVSVRACVFGMLCNVVYVVCFMYL